MIGSPTVGGASGKALDVAAGFASLAEELPFVLWSGPTRRENLDLVWRCLAGLTRVSDQLSYCVEALMGASSVWCSWLSPGVEAVE